MSFEDLEPRPQRGEAIAALGREDLDLYAVDELQERIAALEAEIARSRAAQAVGALSMRAGLFHARYEQLVRMPLP